MSANDGDGVRGRVGRVEIALACAGVTALLTGLQSEGDDGPVGDPDGHESGGGRAGRRGRLRPAHPAAS